MGSHGVRGLILDYRMPAHVYSPVSVPFSFHKKITPNLVTCNNSILFFKKSGISVLAWLFLLKALG